MALTLGYAEDVRFYLGKKRAQSAHPYVPC